MNEQKNDSVSPEGVPALSEVSQIPSTITKERKGILNTIVGLWHTKNPESTPQIREPSLTPATSTENRTPLPPISEISVITVPPVSPDKKTHHHLSEKIMHIFHKTPQKKNIETSLTSELTPETSKPTDTSPDSTKTQVPETPFVIDERFAHLLKQDSTYHSMIRSEDIKNIQLQLSMRYMLLMLAIFVVIAWVVNNRVIMFGFSDFPLLARTRDALFALLTGLFSLTVWFGASVWFRHKIGTLILQIFVVLLFVVVLVSIYLPFWR